MRDSHDLIRSKKQEVDSRALYTKMFEQNHVRQGSTLFEGCRASRSWVLLASLLLRAAASDRQSSDTELFVDPKKVCDILTSFFRWVLKRVSINRGPLNVRKTNQSLENDQTGSWLRSASGNQEPITRVFSLTIIFRFVCRHSSKRSALSESDSCCTLYVTEALERLHLWNV